jgi:hypothetical protein
MEANGFRIHLTVLPFGPATPTLVFIPGTSVYAWFYIEFLVEMNRQGFNVVGFDPRGHGLSSGPRGDYSIDEEVEDTLAVVKCARERFGGKPCRLPFQSPLRFDRLPNCCTIVPGLPSGGFLGHRNRYFRLDCRYRRRARAEQNRRVDRREHPHWPWFDSMGGGQCVFRHVEAESADD